MNLKNAGRGWTAPKLRAIIANLEKRLSGLGPKMIWTRGQTEKDLAGYYQMLEALERSGRDRICD